MRGRLFSTTLLSVAFVVVLVSLCIASDYYVDANASGSGTGESWANAFTSIQAGINACSGASLDTVHVAAATYSENIRFKSQVELLGGYPPGGGARDAEANPTIIDGGSKGSSVTFKSAVGCSIDGFAIENGQATYGGGVYCIQSSPIISNNSFSGNLASYGGAIGCYDSSSPIIDHNTVCDNAAFYSGGGILCLFECSPAISGNAIVGNSAGAHHGGGIYCYYDSFPSISDNLIAANSTKRHGGGLCCEYCSPKAFSNNLIVANSAGRCGGGVYLHGGSPTLVNCTVAENMADSDSDGNGAGGALYFAEPSSRAKVFNCILWGDSPDEVAGETAEAAVEYSDVQGGWAGAGNINEDPLFADSTGGDYSLLQGSPCVDAALSTGAPDFDMVGNPRVDDPYTENTGAGDNGDYYDIGSLERQQHKQKSKCDYNNDGEEDCLYDVIDGIVTMGLHHGTENSLVKKIENAQKSFDKGNTKAGCNQLNAFLNQAEAQRGKRLTEEQADLLQDWVCCVGEMNWGCGLCD